MGDVVSASACLVWLMTSFTYPSRTIRPERNIPEGYLDHVSVVVLLSAVENAVKDGLIYAFTARIIQSFIIANIFDTYKIDESELAILLSFHISGLRGVKNDGIGIGHGLFIISILQQVNDYFST